MDVIFLFLTMAIIIIMFVFLKRPMYEAMIVAYLAVVIFSGNISHLWEYTAGALSNSLLYVTLGFLVFSTLLNKTGIVEDFISIILALIGRISGTLIFLRLIISANRLATAGTIANKEAEKIAAPSEPSLDAINVLLYRLSNRNNPKIKTGINNAFQPFLSASFKSGS